MENKKYDQKITFFDVYKKEGNIVMLGDSLISQINWNELLNRSDIINRGIGGDTTGGMLDRIEFVIKPKPKICFILGGINDLRYKVPPDIISSNIVEIANILLKNNINPIVFSILRVSEVHPEFDFYEKSIKLTNKLIKKMCDNNKIDYIDLNKSLKHMNNKLCANDYFDNIHLTGLGYKKWAEIVLPVIKRKLDL